VSKGAGELQKFLNHEKVNRVILLSDGLANVGPSSPGELGSLGASLIKDGVSVSTIGLGLDYNEDLMTRLADRSDGNHAFVEKSSDLPRIFKSEFGDILSVVAQDIEITIHLAEGFRPIRGIGKDVEIHGQTVVASLNQIYSTQEKYLLLEVEAPPTASGKSLTLANVEVSYANMESKNKERLSGTVGVSFTSSEAEVMRTSNKATLEGYYTQIANENSEKAVQLRDAGKIDEARQTLDGNADLLSENAKRYDLPSLNKKAMDYEGQSKGIASGEWNANRKQMREYEHKSKTQQQW